MNSKMRRVNIDKYQRPRNYEFIKRLDSVLNLSEIARHIEALESKQTFFSQVSRGTDMNANVAKKAQAEDVGELFNEMFYIIGVALGKFPMSPHKKFKYFYKTEEDKLTDPTDKVLEK